MKNLSKLFAIGLLVVSLLGGGKANAQVPQKPKNPPVTDQILNDLKRDKLIIDDGKNLSFELSGKKLTVNGERLPDKVYLRYRKYLGNNPNKTISYKREID